MSNMDITEKEKLIAFNIAGAVGENKQALEEQAKTKLDILKSLLHNNKQDIPIEHLERVNKELAGIIQTLDNDTAARVEALEETVADTIQDLYKNKTGDRAGALKELSYRLNLLNMYMLNDVCQLAGITPETKIKYTRHNNKSYVDMKRKHIRIEARKERIDLQREIVKLLQGCDNGTIDLVIGDISRYLRAEGYRV